MTKILIDRALVEQALGALECANGFLARIMGDDPHYEWLNDNIAALRAALAEPVQEPVEMQDIGSEWKACVKLPVTVHVRAQRPGETHISTREGITPCRPDDLIMRGVAGEEYPISRELFKRTYRLGTALAEPVQEPVAWLYEAGADRTLHWYKPPLYGTPLYTAPPQRKPLTEEEISRL